MDRDKVIGQWLEAEEDILNDLNNDQLFGADRMKEILREAGVEAMRAKEIETKIEAERERLEALTDEELASLIDEEEAMLKELRTLGSKNKE